MVSYSCQLTNEMILTVDTIYDQSKSLLQLNYVAPHPSLLPLMLQALGFIINLNN